MQDSDEYTWTNFLVYCSNGSKIDAIKALRKVSGLGLKKSKDAVEAYMATGDEREVSHYFADRYSDVGCQLAFANGTVVVMPSTGEVKIDGVFTPQEWQKLKKILCAVGERWG